MSGLLRYVSTFPSNVIALSHPFVKIFSFIWLPPLRVVFLQAPSFVVSLYPSFHLSDSLPPPPLAQKRVTHQVIHHHFCTQSHASPHSFPCLLTCLFPELYLRLHSLYPTQTPSTLWFKVFVYFFYLLANPYSNTRSDVTWGLVIVALVFVLHLSTSLQLSFQCTYLVYITGPRECNSFLVIFAK